MKDLRSRVACFNLFLVLHRVKDNNILIYRCMYAKLGSDGRLSRSHNILSSNSELKINSMY